MNAENGWIKLHRKLLDKPIWLQSKPEQKVVLLTLLLMANHESKEWLWRGEKFVAEEGQLITSLNTLSQKSGVSAQSVRTALANFEKLKFLTNESTKTGRLITIVNWELYQNNDDDTNKENNKGVTKHQQRGNKGLTPNKNDKNYKNDKNNNIPKILSEYTSNDELKNALKEFVTMRQKIKAPMTEYGFNLMLKKLDNLSAGSDSKKIQIVEQSIENCWKGIFPLKEGYRGNGTSNIQRSFSGQITTNDQYSDGFYITDPKDLL